MTMNGSFPTNIANLPNRILYMSSKYVCNCLMYDFVFTILPRFYFLQTVLLKSFFILFLSISFNVCNRLSTVVPHFGEDLTPNKFFECIFLIMWVKTTLKR